MLQEQDGRLYSCLFPWLPARQRQIEDVMKVGLTVKVSRALQEAQPMLKLLQEHETRLVKSLDMSQQLQRQHLEFKSELESHKERKALQVLDMCVSISESVL